jgi:hypothetical protein
MIQSRERNIKTI